MRDCADTIAQCRPGDDILIRPIAGGVAAFTGQSSPLNKVAGLGFGGPVDEGQLAEVEDAFAQRSTAVQVELSILGEPSIGAHLTRRGYVLSGFENVLGIRLPATLAHSSEPDIEVRESTAEELKAWMDVVLTGFDRPDTQGVPSHESFPRDVAERVMSDMATAPGFSRYFALRGGEPAGGGSMRIGDGVAHLCGAATLPQHRRRGVQPALLAARLSVAAARGCDLGVIVTLPGSKSQENAQRRGFCLLYTRAILVREAPHG
jgi:GNAT superfamily N-acetyltransferase